MTDNYPDLIILEESDDENNNQFKTLSKNFTPLCENIEIIDLSYDKNVINLNPKSKTGQPILEISLIEESDDDENDDFSIKLSTKLSKRPISLIEDESDLIYQPSNLNNKSTSLNDEQKNSNDQFNKEKILKLPSSLNCNQRVKKLSINLNNHLQNLNSHLTNFNDQLSLNPRDCVKLPEKSPVKTVQFNREKSFLTDDHINNLKETNVEKKEAAQDSDLKKITSNLKSSQLINQRSKLRTSSTLSKTNLTQKTTKEELRKPNLCYMCAGSVNSNAVKIKNNQRVIKYFKDYFAKNKFEIKLDAYTPDLICFRCYLELKNYRNGLLGHKLYSKPVIWHPDIKLIDKVTKIKHNHAILNNKRRELSYVDYLYILALHAKEQKLNDEKSSKNLFKELN